jgi:TonB family protein
VSFGKLRRVWAAGFLVLGMTGLFLHFGMAENPSAGQIELIRKVKTKVPPAYPDLARRMNIRGTVRVFVVVSPNGNIKESKAVGGNPILVNSAMDALKKWKFEPAPEESTGVVEFRFEDTQ